MPRLRGPKVIEPDINAPFLLNHHLFGNHQSGGKTAKTLAERLPLDWASIFGRSAPMALEIGFNRGLFLESLAKREPGKNLLGIEIQRRFCWRLANLLAEDAEAPPNLRLIWADAKLVTETLLPSASVKDIYINFPDPWWKKRHHKRRLVSTAYAAELVSILAAGGEIWVKSDVEAIADEIRAALEAQAQLELSEPYTQAAKPLTHREVRCLEQGLPIYRFRFRKTLT